MHQKKTRQPGYLHHKPSNQAYVRINGRVHYLGRYQSADSHRRYANMMSDYRSGIPVEEHLSRARTRIAESVGLAELRKTLMAHTPSQQKGAG